MATTDANPQTTPSWLLNEKKPVIISTAAQNLADTILNPLKTGDHPGDEAFNKLHMAIKADQSIASQLVSAFGFDKLLKPEKFGGVRFEIDPGEKDILTQLDNVSHIGPGNEVLPYPLMLVFEVVGNGLPQYKAEAILNEVVRPRGEN